MASSVYTVDDDNTTAGRNMVQMAPIVQDDTSEVISGKVLDVDDLRRVLAIPKLTTCTVTGLWIVPPDYICLLKSWSCHLFPQEFLEHTIGYWKFTMMIGWQKHPITQTWPWFEGTVDVYERNWSTLPTLRCSVLPNGQQMSYCLLYTSDAADE